MFLSRARIGSRALLMTALAAALLAPSATPASAEPSLTDIRKRIATEGEKLEDIVEAYNKLREETKQTQAAQKKLTADLGPVRTQMLTARTEVGTIAARAYMTGRAGAADALLDGDGNLVDRLGMLEQLARRRQHTLTTFGAKAAEFEQRQATLKTAQARQAAQARELKAQRKKIERDLAKLYELRRQAYGEPESSGRGYTGKIPPVSGKAGVAVRFAYKAIGKPYRWGADGPNGYDCSGLTLAAWRKAGKSLPHNAAMQYDVVAKISRSQLRPGDLVFYRGLGHVALFVGNGKVIDAPHAGESVSLRSIDLGMSIVGYGRVR